MKRSLGFFLSTLLGTTSKNILGFMSLTYSITGLLVVLGLAGKHVLAADVAMVQGAVLATFYVLSGDARHLILTNQIDASKVVFFRLVLVLPLAALSYLMSTIAGEVNATIAFALILRRSMEWLAEPHVTQIEKHRGKWSGWFLQPVLFALIMIQFVLSDQIFLIWIWAVSPIFFSLKFISQAKRHNLFKINWENLGSTAIIGLTGYVYRLLIIGLVGKELSGMFFPGFAIGGFIGSMAANVVGPSAINKGWLQPKLFTLCIIVCSLTGLSVFLFSDTLLYRTVGLSTIGGAIMILAQQSRLFQLKNNHMLEMDLLLHLMLIVSVPVIFIVGGSHKLSSYYLIGSIIAWVFYKGSSLAMSLNNIWKQRLLISIIICLILPIFIQLNGHIYNTWQNVMVDSGGRLGNVPLPISLLACYAGVIFFSTCYKYSKAAIITIATTFLFLVISVLVTNQGIAKLMLLMQYLLPFTALLLGLALAEFDHKLIAKIILYFLTIFIPSQIIISWLQGQLALSHYMYLFSVYQHYQYVPLVMTALFVWVWVELHETHIKLIYFLAPFMAFYVAAGNSIVALFGLLAFAGMYAIRTRKFNSEIFIPIVIFASIVGYFYINSHLAYSIRMQNISHNVERHGVFVAKLFDKNGVWLYGNKGKGSELPENVSDRAIYMSIYMSRIMESPMAALFGHASPPPRAIASSAHNYYIDLTYNFGLLACIPMLLLLLYTIWLCIKSRHTDKSILWLLAIVLYFAVIDNNLKVTMRQPYPGIIAFFLWGILLHRPYTQKHLSAASAT